MYIIYVHVYICCCLYIYVYISSPHSHIAGNHAKEPLILGATRARTCSRMGLSTRYKNSEKSAVLSFSVVYWEASWLLRISYLAHRAQKMRVCIFARTRMCVWLRIQKFPKVILLLNLLSRWIIQLVFENFCLAWLKRQLKNASSRARGAPCKMDILKSQLLAQFTVETYDGADSWELAQDEVDSEKSALQSFFIVNGAVSWLLRNS